ncbi:amidohydrolase family protein [Isoptericola sp. NEAU-Y5]|uniref:Amidohydrolase family protein n=1 Tax=Isoptericola luteus TaxID=2879484 RepID=A0ABS7ZI99_9MICO|nr:amidohydrolase family protein [Isoptericola sp. NEAU-Y5]MCA5894745.1 amidohydrolase family protein [Isoptericola sp. NEAU-Y5]
MTSTLYRNGVVHSSADPFAEALLVDDGVVTWLGSEDTAAGLAARADRVLDLDGALVAPGFVDAHAHVLETGLALESVDLSAAAGVASLPAALDAVAAGARALAEVDPSGSEVLLAFGWDEQAWPERRAPGRTELDAAAGGRPVYAARVDGHSAVLSSALARGTGADRLPGWDESGLVVGDAHHAARDLVQQLSGARRTRAYEVALTAAARRGIVGLHEMSAPHVDTRDGLRELMAMTRDPAGGLPHVVAYRGELVGTVDEAHQLLAELPFLTGIGGDLSVDGSLGSRTAALRHPYADMLAGPGGADATGRLYLTAEEIAAHLAACSAARTQGGFHVIGDRAMDEVVHGLEIAAAEHGASVLRAGHHRLEHALFVDASALAALLLYGVALSVQPAFDSTFGGTTGMYAGRLGVARATNLSPFADLASAGVPLAFGSDAPVTPLDPWQGVRATLRHEDTTQRISARTAFRAHTRGGWRLAGLDHTGAGELRVGAPAHLAVWRAEQLAVQAAPGRLSQWNPEARAGQPLLPDLSPGAAEPECLQTVRDGVVLFDTFD